MPVDSQTSYSVPPFTMKSMLALCWGITAIFSHSKEQRDMGQEFKNRFSDLCKDITLDQNDKIFMQNVFMALGRTLRNMAFIRENHVRFLDSKNQLIQNKKKTFDEQSSFTSFSKQSIVSKIVSFVGGTISINYVLPYLGSGHIGGSFNKNATLQITQNVTIPSLSTPLEKLGSSNNSPNMFPMEIASIILGGLLSTMLVIILFKFLSKYYAEGKNKKIQKEQNVYWVNKFKPDMRNSLYYLYLDLRELIENNYHDYYTSDKAEEILNWTENQVKDYIQNQILPTDEIDWAPYDYFKLET